MKKTVFFILVMLPFFQIKANASESLKIAGQVKNSNQEYVYLAHQPLYRGNFNFDGFKSIGQRIDDQGNFTLASDHLIDAAYNLNTDQFTLTPNKLELLIKSNKGKNVYLLFWSAKFGGAAIPAKLPSIIDFEKEQQGKMEIIYVCIDESEYKKLWAAKIIDISWEGNHYFLPSENNESIIEQFTAQNLSSFCNGGISYTFIDKAGKMTNNIESPLLLTTEKIDQYMKNSGH